MPPTLTVAIPTYNRNAILNVNLRPLLEQMALPEFASKCRLLVIDNASPVPVQNTMQSLVEQFPTVRVDIERNRLNVGANANILRCFEHCETEFMWLLGDDDAVEPDAIATILRHIEARPDCLYFNFLAGYDNLNERPQEIWTRGLKEFVERVDSIANVLFISSGVYRIPGVNTHLNMGYAYLHTQPNFIPLLTSLGDEGVCCLAREQIVTYHKPENSHQWSFLYYGLGIMTLLELQIPHNVRETLARKILASIPWHKMFALQLMAQALRENDPRGALYLYDQLCARLYYFERTPARRAKIALYRAMVRYPAKSREALTFFKRKKASDYALPNSLERL